MKSRKPQALSPPQRDKAKLLVLSSAKGGSGKTTTTRNLAICALHDGLSIATVDLDAQGSLTLWFKRRPDEAPAFQHFQVPLEVGLDAIKSIIALPDLDLVLVDTPPGVEANPAAIKAIMHLADFILIPTGQGAPDLETVIDWATIVRREGRRCAFLLNRSVRTKNSFSEAKLELSRVGALCPFDVRDLEDIQRTHRTGLGVVEVRGAAGAADFNGVWNYLRREIGLETAL
ncbi:MAG: AAA family ATPase [Janthinobacterium lividum]